MKSPLIRFIVETGCAPPLSFVGNNGRYPFSFFTSSINATANTSSIRLTNTKFKSWRSFLGISSRSRSFFCLYLRWQIRIMRTETYWIWSGSQPVVARQRHILAWRPGLSSSGAWRAERGATGQQFSLDTRFDSSPPNNLSELQGWSCVISQKKESWLKKRRTL